MFSRRDVLIGGGAILGVSFPAHARLVCQDFPGYRTCSAGVTVALQTARQAKQNWCWAACIEAVFGFHDRKVSQRRIVEKVFGSDFDRPAMGPQIVFAVNGEWKDDSGDTFAAAAEVLWDSQFQFGRPDAVIQAARELEADNPLILGALGHATVLTAMTYSGNGYMVQLNELIVRDPWPGSPNRRTLSAQEAFATQFLAKIRVG